MCWHMVSGKKQPAAGQLRGIVPYMYSATQLSKWIVNNNSHVRQRQTRDLAPQFSVRFQVYHRVVVINSTRSLVGMSTNCNTTCYV